MVLFDITSSILGYEPVWPLLSLPDDPWQSGPLKKHFKGSGGAAQACMGTSECSRKEQRRWDTHPTRTNGTNGTNGKPSGSSGGGGLRLQYKLKSLNGECQESELFKTQLQNTLGGFSGSASAVIFSLKKIRYHSRSTTQISKAASAPP